MKLQHATFKRIAITIAVGAFLALAFALPSVSAQGENPVTPTPSGPLLTPEPLQAPETQQEFAPQPFEIQPTRPPAEEWSSQADISYTTTQSSNPKIASDINGVEHFVWSENISGGKQEIYYSQIYYNLIPQNEGVIQSPPVNVSNSSSFSSTSPQIVVDNTGVAHIVWQEEDNDHNDDYEVFYSHCDLDTPKTMTFATPPKNDFSV